MSKQIPLTQGQFALVDDEDYDNLNQFSWYANYDKHTNGYYAIRSIQLPNGKRTLQRMHRLIMNAQKGEHIDHRNHNSLDNRKANLRTCTNSQNQMNSKLRKGTSSKFKGVSWNKRAKKWVAWIQINGKNTYLGLFNDEVEAANAYDKKAIKLFGEFALTNKKLFGGI